MGYPIRRNRLVWEGKEEEGRNQQSIVTTMDSRFLFSVC